MCGIAGIVTSDGSTPDTAVVSAMARTLAHRGPDGEGVVARPWFGFGHRRLSVIDLANGSQPMGGGDGHYWITFNGEIYNYRDLRRSLEGHGHRFVTSSDTEVLLHLLADRGVGALADARGMFALGFWDNRTHRLILARDRAGKKPLYWFRDARGLYFASELKALLTLPNCPLDVNPQALDLYLTYEAIPGTQTIFSGIHRLAPASTLTWSPGGEPVIERYWEARWQPKTTLSYQDARRQLRDLIVDATRARLIADVPVGAFLSGGVDSSAIVAAMAECSAGPVRTFSIGFADQAFNETPYARRVAQQFHTTHEEFIVEPDAVDVLPRLAWFYDQPFADSSALPSYYLSQMTRRHVTVALNGDGGDELFGGYERYRALLVHAAYHAATIPALRHLVERVSRLLPGIAGGGTGLVSQLRFFADAGRMSREQFNLRLFNHRQFEASERRTLYTPDYAQRVGPSGAEAVYLELMAESADRVGDDVVERALRTDGLMYLPDTLLVKVDIASMAVGLEARSPLLDTTVMEFAASLPRDWKVTHRQSKRILKAAFEDVLPHDLLYRRKMGFSIPIRHWFRHELYDYAREILLDSRTLSRGYFRRDVIERLLTDHRVGTRNNSARIWSLLMLEHWHRELLDARLNPSATPPPGPTGGASPQ